MIKQGLTLRQVLNLSIGPNGKTNNQVQDTENVAYFATTSNDLRVSWSQKAEDVWFSDETINAPLEKGENQNSPIKVNERGASVETQDPPHFVPFSKSQNSFSQEIDKENEFVSSTYLQPPGNIDGIFFFISTELLISALILRNLSVFEMRI